MKKQYNFSKGERGKFYNKDATFYLPIYLDPQIDKIIREYAQKKNVETDSLINDWLKNNIEVIQSVSD